MVDKETRGAGTNPSGLPVGNPDPTSGVTTTSWTDRPFWVLGGMIVGFVLLVAALTGALIWLTASGLQFAEVSLTLVVIACVLILLLALTTAAIIFKRLGLADRRHAMGLPEGSIRALIALLLILIFATVGVFIITFNQSSDQRVFSAISEEQAIAFSEGQTVLEWTVLEEDAGVDDDGDPLIKLVLKAEKSASTEMSQQLLTILGTLVVAVASFYFGSQVVLTATAVEGADTSGGEGSGVGPVVEGPGPKGGGGAASGDASKEAGGGSRSTTRTKTKTIERSEGTQPATAGGQSGAERSSAPKRRFERFVEPRPD